MQWFTECVEVHDAETFQTEGAAYEKERCQNVFERTCATPRVPESQGELSPTGALSRVST